MATKRKTKKKMPSAARAAAFNKLVASNSVKLNNIVLSRIKKPSKAVVDSYIRTTNALIKR